MNPNTFLRCLGPKPWNVAYVEPVIRPLNGRYGENPYRFQHYFQYQVVLKPAPEDVLDRYFASLEAIGIVRRHHDIRLVGAAGAASAHPRTRARCPPGRGRTPRGGGGGRGGGMGGRGRRQGARAPPP